MLTDFIENFGNSNLIVLFILLGVVIIITIATFSSDRKSIKNKKESLKEEPKKENKFIKQEELTNQTNPIENKEIINESTEQEKALKKLEELKEELQNPKDLCGPTNFELEQEKTAIINYEELRKASQTVDLKDEQLLKDEGNEPISIDDLYNKDKKFEQTTIFEESKTKNEELQEKLRELEMLKPKETNKFKKSEILSPVFGMNRYGTLKESEMRNQVEVEIAKTERFLQELKELRNKLD